MDDLSTNYGSFDEDSLIMCQGNAALQDGEIDAACSYFIKVVRDSSNDANVKYCHSKIAECHYRRDRWRDCMESAKLSFTLPDSEVLFALCLFHKKDPHAALEIIEVRDDPSSLSDFVRQELELREPEIRDAVASTPRRLPVIIEEKVKELKVQGNHKFKSKDFNAASKLYRDGIRILEDWFESLGSNSTYRSDKDIIEQVQNLHSVLLSNLLNCEMNQNNLNSCRNLCDKLIDMRSSWKKSYYWSAMCYLSCFQFQEAEQHFNMCLSCPGSENDSISEKIKFVKFLEVHQSRLEGQSILHWQEVFESHSKNMSWLAGNLFAMSITKIYHETDTHWHMTTSALIDNSGKITNFMAPKYEASEKDRNLINEMKRNEKKKFYVHLTQIKADGSQQIGFTDTDNLSPIAKLSLSVLEEEINCKGVFNAFVKNYLK